jgi:hypothetical protein
MSAPVSPSVSRPGARVRARAFALAAALAALPVQALVAQQTPGAATSDREAASPAWLERVAVSARYGVLLPSGRGEAFSLIDRALAPGAGALRPKLAGGALHVRVAARWEVLLGAEAGGSTVASTSRARPASADADVRQQTSLDFRSVQYLGAEWRALRWRGAGPDAPDRLRLVLGAGAGSARYRLRQWGDFVDAERLVAFRDEFGSTGRGPFGYGSAGVEVPLRPHVTLVGDLRRQWGSAPMSRDFAAFDRLDLGGTRLGAGVRLGVGKR